MLPFIAVAMPEQIPSSAFVTTLGSCHGAILKGLPAWGSTHGCCCASFTKMESSNALPQPTPAATCNWTCYCKWVYIASWQMYCLLQQRTAELYGQVTRAGNEQTITNAHLLLQKLQQEPGRPQTWLDCDFHPPQPVWGLFSLRSLPCNSASLDAIVY